MPDLVSDTADSLYRHAGARVVARLTAQVGPEHLELAEDAVQDALISALRTWPHSGVPTDTAAWLYIAARNRALDLLRRDARALPLTENRAIIGLDADAPEVMDAELRMLFMCCHPRLSSAARVALSLSIVGGLSTGEIGRALLMSESAVRQSIVRSKRHLRDDAVSLDFPPLSELEARLDSVLSSLYLMFNEGYSAFEGERVVRTELCNEAIRMCGLLTDNRATDLPSVHALAALMLFQGARLDARTGDEGEALTLRRQSRSKWNSRMISLGFAELERGALGGVITSYHLEAEIASYHARADSYEATDWNGIVSAYDALLELNPSPVAELARAVAVGERDGAEAGLSALSQLSHDDSLADYPFFHAARAELLQRSGNAVEAKEAYSRALALSVSMPVRRTLVDQFET